MRHAALPVVEAATCASDRIAGTVDGDAAPAAAAVLIWRKETLEIQTFGTQLSAALEIHRIHDLRKHLMTVGGAGGTTVHLAEQLLLLAAVGPTWYDGISVVLANHQDAQHNVVAVQYCISAWYFVEG